MIKKICVFISILFLISSCSSKNDKQRPTRLVDSKGNPKSLERKVPKFNQAQIKKQQMSDPNMMIMNGNSDYNQNNMPNDIFADKGSQKKVDITQVEKDNDAVIFKATEQEKKLKEELINKRENKTQKAKTNTKKATKTKQPKKTTRLKKQSKSTPVATKTKNKTASRKETYYIQLGAYKYEKNANSSLNKYSNIGKGLVKSYTNKKGNVIYRSVLGPYNSRSRAEKDLEKIIQRGHYDVYITRR